MIDKAKINNNPESKRKGDGETPRNVGQKKKEKQ